jgi:hypothetical protein
MHIRVIPFATPEREISSPARLRIAFVQKKVLNRY